MKRAFVCVSPYHSIYKNLALEHLLLNRTNFEESDGLLVWRNHPAVVIGRFQNPWVESDVCFLSASGIGLARRASGGGAVYHDLNNINFSFMTSKRRHDRDANLRTLQSVVRQLYGIDLDLGKRHDLFLEGTFKVSGSAARITSRGAYHHFTLMIDVDLQRLAKALRPTFANITCRSTRSVCSEVKTLRSFSSTVTCEDIIDRMVKVYTQSYKEIDFLQNPVHYNENLLEPSLSRFTSWEWIYGRTPAFCIDTPIATDDASQEATSCIRVSVRAGLVETVELRTASGSEVLQQLTSTYSGCRFDERVQKNIVKLLRTVWP